MALLALLSGSACTPPAQSPEKQREQVVWRSLGSWSGRGSEQTDSFTSDTGALRIQWEAKPTGNSPTPGKLRLTIHSSISGRPLSSALVDHKGAGKGTAYVSEDPRVFFVVVESQGLDWSFTIDERLR